MSTITVTVTASFEYDTTDGFVETVEEAVADVRSAIGSMSVNQFEITAVES